MGAFLSVAALGLITSCSNAPQAIENPSRVLQSVDVELASNASIASVNGTAIAVDDASGESSTTTNSFAPAEVAGDLPVRVSTHYRTDKASGTDLKDLAGYTGRVQIELSVENLTVAPREVSFDVAGQNRTEPALVGAPMTIAASAEIPGLSPNNIVAASGSDETGTNGIISAAANGNTVIQWATLLAPPVSPATTTLRLVAEVQDFTVPGIDLAVQPGMHTDLSAEGVLDTAFNESATSELALQRRTIELITDVNEVLARAGGTITELRTNLESTSDTLGVSTVQHLRESSESLAGTLSGLKQQLGQLETDLGSTVTAADSATTAQLMQTVSTMDRMLGDTSAQITKPALKGEGCQAMVAPKGEASSVYSNLMLISAQLEGYAESTAGCRDELADNLQRIVGPADPGVENCDTPSLTCAFRASSISVTGELIKLVLEGDKLVQSLQPEIIGNAISSHEAIAGSLIEMQSALDALQTTADTDEVTVALKALRESLKVSEDNLAAVEKTVGSIHDIATENAALVGHPEDSKSIAGQNAALVKEICKLANRRQVTETAARELIASLTANDTCVIDLPPLPTETPEPEPTGETSPSPSDSTTPAPEPSETPAESVEPTESTEPTETSAPAESPSPTEVDAERAAFTKPLITGGPKEPMDERLAAQAKAWNSVAALSNLENDDSGLGQQLTASKDQLKDIAAKIDAVEAAATNGSGNIQDAIDELRAALQVSLVDSKILGKSLADLQGQQERLEAGIEEAFGKASTETQQQVNELIDGQIRVLSEQGATSREAVLTAFNRSVTGLSGTSGEVAADAKATVDKQHAQLNEQAEALTKAIGEQTASSLEQIAARTTASTRDVEGGEGLLSASLSKVLLDLGDRSSNGSGLLGALATSAAMSDTADYQLALATEHADGYANVRAEDIAAILHRQAQFKAALEAAGDLPSFHLQVSEGTSVRTLYAFHLQAGK